MIKEKKISVWGELPKTDTPPLPINIFDYLVSLPDFYSHVRMRKTDYFDQINLVGNALDYLTIRASQAGWFFADDPPNAQVIFFRGDIYVRRIKQKQENNELLNYIDSVVYHTLFCLMLKQSGQ